MVLKASLRMRATKGRGNHLRGLPELLVIGVSRGEFLNFLSDKMIERGRAFDDGEVVSLRGLLVSANSCS